MKRSRGRGGRKVGNSRQQVFDSNGPSVRIRGSAMQIYEKYSQMARDNASTDRVAAENLAQHAEHYFRVAQAQAQQQMQAQQQHQQNAGHHQGGGNQPHVNGAARDGGDRRPQANGAGHGANGAAPAAAPEDANEAPAKAAEDHGKEPERDAAPRRRRSRNKPAADDAPAKAANGDASDSDESPA